MRIKYYDKLQKQEYKKDITLLAKFVKNLIVYLKCIT